MYRQNTNNQKVERNTTNLLQPYNTKNHLYLMSVPIWHCMWTKSGVGLVPTRDKHC